MMPSHSVERGRCRSKYRCGTGIWGDAIHETSTFHRSALPQLTAVGRYYIYVIVLVLIYIVSAISGEDEFPDINDEMRSWRCLWKCVSWLE